MGRFLIKKSGKTIDFVSVPKGAKIVTTKMGKRIVKGKKKGFVFRGFKTVQAKSSKIAIQKVIGKKIMIRGRK